MSERHVHSIAGRLSLRPPQRESLGLLHDIVEALNPHKGQSVEEALAIFQQSFPDLVKKGFAEFEREFPSFCFGVATGVGKTRLMGAFITYLVTARNIRHFMVLAPNLTIYNKLIDDFSNRTSPKYVFQGIAEFAQEAPYVVTGDTYESVSRSQADMFGEMGVTINIFNISKINSEVRGGREPRVRKTREILGESYYDYLAGLPDLVLLMDESHRYRASAGVKAINELKPILGLELTATPKVKAGGTAFTDFKNVVFSYPLNRAIEDGFVKEPAVATRENFRREHYEGEDGKLRLEKLKLEDGIRVHENVKVDLEAYARQTGSRMVKPFMLVVAQDTKHADELQRVVGGESFFEGRYAGKVITVHSNQSGEEKDEHVQRLLAVEDSNEPTEIVIHVNKLQEGWDVTNLFTIVPLRASASDILTEQTMGRGLRLPYGRRTGNKSIDRLTIIAHEHFQRIIDDANLPSSMIRSGVVIGRDIPIEKKKVVETRPHVYTRIDEQADLLVVAEDEAPYVREVKVDALRKTLEVIQHMERLPSGTDLRKPENVARITKDVQEIIRTRATGDLIESTKAAVDIGPEVKQAIELYLDGSISVPKIVIQPKDTAETFFNDFDMETRVINLQPVAHNILIKHLQSQDSDRIRGGTGIVEEKRPEDYIVRHLIGRNDIS
jgi:type III restriction enzyme